MNQNLKHEHLNNCVFLCCSSATGLLCGAIMSDHWEEIGWDKENLIHANVNITWYLNGQVARLESSINHRNKHRVAKSSSFLVPMHGGIWIMCVSLSGTSCCGFDNVKLRPKTAHTSIVHTSGFKYIVHDCVHGTMFPTYSMAYSNSLIIFTSNSLPILLVILYYYYNLIIIMGVFSSVEFVVITYNYLRKLLLS